MLLGYTIQSHQEERAEAPAVDVHYPVSLVMMKSGFISKLL